jgi:hypothetical protein
MSARDVVAAYWAAANARDWAAFGDRERIRSRETYVRFNAEYPGDWTAEPVRIVGDGAAHAASWTRFLVDGAEQPGLCFFDLDEAGLIARITDFWPYPYDAPPGREHLTERF